MANGGHASGDSVVGVTIAFTILAVLCAVSRLFTRFGIVHSAGLDDAFIAAAVFFSCVLTACICLQVKYGMGQHEYNLNDHDKIYSGIWFWTSVWIYYLGLGCAKLSILLQYLRIFPHKTFRLVTYILMAVVVIYTIWTITSAIFACTPIRYFWMQGVEGSPEGHCLNRLAVWFVNASLNIATDLAVAVLPLPLVKSLNLPKRPKLALMIVFCLGGVTCIVSLLRLQSLYAISVSNDVSWDNPLASVWSSLEVNIGIICSCLPTLKACVLRIFPRFFSSARGTSSGNAMHDVHSGGRKLGSRTPHRDPHGNSNIGLRYVSPAERHDVYGGPLKTWEDVEIAHVRPGLKGAKEVDGDGIHVTTVLQQAVRQGDDGNGSSDSGSTRTLVRDIL